MSAPVKRFICSVFVGLFNVNFKCSYTLDYIATLSPKDALHGLAVRAIQRKVVLSVFELVC